MKVTGLIAEYNPFHKGHQYHMEKAKEITGADYIVTVMSGDYVQRGTPALFSKEIRAKMALSAGADLVLELPVQYATASAELFASGGVQILDQLGVVDNLCFGSESTDLDAMMDIATILLEEPAWYQASLKEQLKTGVTYPVARALALKKHEDLLKGSNNILGIEYCKAILAQHSSIQPVILKRKGNTYHENELNEGLPSATALRKLLENTEADKRDALLEQYLPETVYPILQEALGNHADVTVDDFSQLLLYRLLLICNSEELNAFADMSKDLALRIMKNRTSCTSFSSFAEEMKTKDITRTRVNRALLHVLLDLKKEKPITPYLRVLGFKKSAEPLLKEIKKAGKPILLTKPANYKKVLSEKQQTLFEEDVRASMIYEAIVSAKTNRSIIHEFEKTPIKM